ncbi:DUF6075 family protein [Paenibacillus sp. MER 78]|uniref:DUF6075 family protein n=1 Tax=Paenibacillus sp. MER 78 TaxID=2939571 RepID=UPI0037C788B8
MYDFGERNIRPEAFEEIDLTSGTRALLELAFNLYNNYPSRSIVSYLAVGMKRTGC